MVNISKVAAFEPEKLEALIHLIEEDLGYILHGAVQEVKCNLSNRTEASFRFSAGVIEIEATVTRTDFEDWIADELKKIEGCVDSLLAASGVLAGDVDKVFLTGGSSFVPAVRRIFESRFGSARFRAGNEFTSVAHGLAWKAAQRGGP
jgi:hypothetical chaperone protein